MIEPSIVRELHGTKIEANISKKKTDPDHKKISRHNSKLNLCGTKTETSAYTEP